MRLSHELKIAQIGRCPVVGPLEQLGQGEHTSRNLGHSPIVKQFMSVAAPDGEAGRLQSHDWRPRRDVRVQHVQSGPKLAPGPVTLAGADPGEPAARRAIEELRRISGSRQHGDGGGYPFAGEAVGERVDPDDDRLAIRLRQADTRPR